MTNKNIAEDQCVYSGCGIYGQVINLVFWNSSFVTQNVSKNSIKAVFEPV